MKISSVVILSVLLLISCSKEPEQSPEPVSTEKNVFEELKERTLSNPKDSEAWFHLADLYDRNGMYREEIDALSKAITLDPKKGYAYLNIANAYSRTGQYPEAIKNYTKAAGLFPKNPVIYNNLAVAYGKTGKTTEEVASLQKAIALRPRYSTARFNLGVTLLKQGKRDLALQQYQELRKFDETAAMSLKKEIDAKNTMKKEK